MRHLVILLITGMLCAANSASFAVEQKDIDLARKNAEYAELLARQTRAEADRTKLEAQIAKNKANKAKYEKKRLGICSAD